MNISLGANPIGALHRKRRAVIGRCLTRHRARLRAAVQRMIARVPDRIVSAHGRRYETQGVAQLRRAFRWVL
jgi:hypothetical protein